MILAIDPGPLESAWVLCGEDAVIRFGKSRNELLLQAIETDLHGPSELIVEKISSYGMSVGAEIFETVFWTGRFIQAYSLHLKPFHRLPRIDVKMHLCHDSRAKDKNIRQAIIDRYGGIKAVKKGGRLHGISGDVWAALGVALTWQDRTAE